MKKTTNQTAIGYIRVSTEHQLDGISLDTQQAKIESWTKANGYQLQTFTDAGISGCKMQNRPGLQDALDTACKQKAVLVVYSLSRLVRSTRDALAISERLDKAGADLVSLTEKIDTTSAAGKMIFRVLAVLAEFERDIISERTSAALQHLRRQGKRVSGKIPFGYDLVDDNNLVENPTEQHGIEIINELRQEGYSLRKIGTELEHRGISTKEGQPWTAKVINSILKRSA